MKIIDDIMDAMGIVDEVEVEEPPRKPREARESKAVKSATKPEDVAEEKAEPKESPTDKIKNLFKRKEAEPEEVAVETAKEEKKEPVTKRRLNFDFTNRNTAKEEAPKEKVEAPAPKKSSFAAAPKEAPAPRRAPAYNAGSINMQMIEPTSFDDSQKIADFLNGNQPVIVNFEKTDPIVAKRMTDFISGTIYALKGNMKKIGRNILVCAPKNVDIDNGLSNYLDRGDE